MPLTKLDTMPALVVIDWKRESPEKILPRLGETDTTENVLKLLRP